MIAVCTRCHKSRAVPPDAELTACKCGHTACTIYPNDRGWPFPLTLDDREFLKQSHIRIEDAWTLPDPA